MADLHDELAAWIAAQAGRSAAALAACISATHLSHRRPGFGQTVLPRQGSVLASPFPGAWNPEPDYFFHWVRDSALAMRAGLRLADAATDEIERAAWLARFEAFLDFSRDLDAIDGADFLATSTHRQATAPEFRQYLRDDGEIATLVGDRLLGEPRFNPDGTPDVQRWSRPQFDGPALRALAGLDAWRLYGVFGRPRPEALAPRLARDLDFTLRHAGTPCIGPWEEPDAVGRHYYVCLAQAGALHHGADWADAASDAATATHYRKAANRLLDGLDEHWSEARGFYVAMREAPGPESALDAAVLLAALDAQLPAGRHSPADPRLRATLTALERHFGDALPINRDRPQGVGIMLGRDVGDRYFGGGAWFPTTLAAARFHYLAGEPDRGDATMRAVRRFAGTDGALSEQVDPTTGAPTSAPNLAWSHAAFIEAALTRPPDAGSRSRGE